MGRRHWLGSALAFSLAVLGIGGWMVSLSQTGGLSQPVDQPVPEQSREAIHLPSVNPAVMAANTRFGFKLFAEVVKQANDQNVLISPSSVAIALAMTYNGARAETQQAMAEALQVQALSLEDVNQANAALEVVLEEADPEVTVAIANSLWGREAVPFYPPFLDSSRQFYNADIANLDFADPATVSTINDWVSRQTQGKIPTILDQINPDDVLFLINAIYFQGTWSEPFNPRHTSMQPFYRADGSRVDHPLMSQSGSYRYLENDLFQAVQVPYGSGRWTMVILLPRQESSLEALQANLTAENWSTWMTAFSHRQGTLQLPRFKAEFGTQLNEALKAMGMEIAFDPNRADFSGIGPEQMVISRVQHKTYIEVDEQGTEAAASTAVGVAVTSAPIDPPFSMRCDRPFFYAIHDQETGTILFMGSVVEPE